MRPPTCTRWPPRWPRGDGPEPPADEAARRCWRAAGRGSVGRGPPQRRSPMRCGPFAPASVRRHVGHLCTPDAGCPRPARRRHRRGHAVPRQGQRPVRRAAGPAARHRGRADRAHPAGRGRHRRRRALRRRRRHHRVRRAWRAGAVRDRRRPRGSREIGDAFLRALNAVAAIPCPTIAAVAGVAFGGGCELALACDFRVAGESSRFGQPEILLGIIPGGGGTQRLPRLVGTARAKDIVFSGRTVDADEALAIGLVDRVVASDAVLDEALAWAATFAAGPRHALALAKAAIDEGLERHTRRGAAHRTGPVRAVLHHARRCDRRAVLPRRGPRQGRLRLTGPGRRWRYSAQATRPNSVGVSTSSWRGTTRTVTPIRPATSSGASAAEASVPVVDRPDLGPSAGSSGARARRTGRRGRRRAAPRPRRGAARRARRSR